MEVMLSLIALQRGTVSRVLTFSQWCEELTRPSCRCDNTGRNLTPNN
jgi:hypothetical protein